VNVDSGAQDFTRTAETKRRHALEKHDKDLVIVHALEVRLGITRWVLGSPEYEEAGRLVAMRKYQRCLDNLEALVVARIFELTKMNRSQTGELCIVPLSKLSHIDPGYALRKHIAQSLQKRSTAVRSALDQYNTTTKALRPPRTTLRWEDVVEYAFLSDFDLLCDTRQDI
jgi:hypothetical protein